MQTALWHKHAPHSHTDTHVTQVPPRDSAMPGRTKLYPVTAALHEFSLVSHRAPQVQSTDSSPQSRIHDYIFATAATATATGPLTTTLPSSFLQLTMAVLTTSQPQSGGVSPDNKSNKASPVA